MAPTSVTVSEQTPYTSLLDFRRPPPETLCFHLTHPSEVGVVVEFYDPSVEGVMALFTANGELVEAKPFDIGTAEVEILASLAPGRPAACVQIKAAAGTTVYEARWRKR